MLLVNGMLTTLAPNSRFSRRTLFKALGLGGAAALMPARSRAAVLPETGQEMATLLDLSKCIGCGACVDACRETNAARFPEPKKPFPKMYPARVKAEYFSDKRGVTDRLTPYNWLFIQSARADGREVFIPRRCMHCQNPPCANLCPWGAASKKSDGAVSINPDICLGGAKCRDVCPWEVPQRQAGVGLYLDLMPSLGGNGVMYKCDRCAPRVAAGKLPACVEACPEGVQEYGPREMIVAKAKAQAKSSGGYLYGLEENGGTNTIYLSPVPFEKLNASLMEDKHGGRGRESKPGRMAQQGFGRPHLAATADVMAGSNTLAWAVLLAPLAGIASAFLKGSRKVLDASSKSAARPESPVRKEDRNV